MLVLQPAKKRLTTSTCKNVQRLAATAQKPAWKWSSTCITIDENSGSSRILVSLFGEAQPSGPGRGGPLPDVEDSRDLTPDSLPCRLAIGVLRKQLVVLGVRMADMGDHRQADGLRAEFFRRRRASHAAAVLAASMFRDFGRFLRRAPGILLADRAGKRGYKLAILDLTALGGSLLSPGPCFRVRERFLFRMLEALPARPGCPGARSASAHATSGRRQRRALSTCRPGA